LVQWQKIKKIEGHPHLDPLPPFWEGEEVIFNAVGWLLGWMLFSGDDTFLKWNARKLSGLLPSERSLVTKSRLFLTKWKPWGSYSLLDTWGGCSLVNTVTFSKWKARNFSEVVPTERA
jgi:hypothetical protein